MSDVSLTMTYNDEGGSRRERAFPNVKETVTNAEVRNFAAQFEANGQEVLPEGLSLLAKAEKTVTTVVVIYPSDGDDIDTGAIPDSGPLPVPETALDSGVIPDSGPLPVPEKVIDSGLII